jgi:Spy/CpxP family protein refolding chaperone
MKTKLLLGVVLGTLLLCGMATGAAESDNNQTSPSTGRGAAAGGLRGKVQERFKEMGKKLGLTEEQKAKLRDLMMEEMRKLRDLRRKGDVSDKRAAFRKFQESLGEKIKESKILTDEQLEKWKELRGVFGSRRGRTA